MILLRIISLLYLSSGAYFLVRADEEVVDPCIALQERVIDIYNDPGCAHARMLIEQRDFWAWEAPADPKNGDPAACSDARPICAFNLTEMLGFVVHECEYPEPAEEVSEFVYTFNEHRREFTQSNKFYCGMTATGWNDCYGVVRDALHDPTKCNITEPFSDDVDAYLECFRSVPCDCVRDFFSEVTYTGLYTASDEFLDMVALPRALIDAASQAGIYGGFYGSGLCGDVDTEPSTSGVQTVGISLSILLVASIITL